MKQLLRVTAFFLLLLTTLAALPFAHSLSRSLTVNILVNDPTTDIPEQTTQSETTIAVYKNIVPNGRPDPDVYFSKIPISR